MPHQHTFAAELVIDDGDMTLRRALPAAGIKAIGPFVFMDHYLHVSPRGIGDRAHPHAGIEVVSYLMNGEVHHRDSMGNSDVISAGEVQVICAGRGMLHVERPKGGRHGLQMWTSLPPELKAMAPKYRRFTAEQIATAEDDAGKLRVICGEVCDIEGPVFLARDTLLAHASLPKGASRTFTFKAHLEAAAYILLGSATCDGVVLQVGMLRRADSNGELRVHASQEQCEILLFGGEHASEPVLFSGPFVMDTEQKLTQARIDFLSGAMGTLDNVP